MNEIVEGKRFQIRTDKKIDKSNAIRWLMKGVGWFIFTTGSIDALNCKRGYRTFSKDEGFFQRAGDLTFLKTTTQLQVRFDDVLEVTWVYEDNINGSTCDMRKEMTGLRFRANSKYDKVSTEYRYELGKLPIASYTENLISDSLLQNARLEYQKDF